MSNRTVRYTVYLDVDSYWTDERLEKLSPIFRAFDVWGNSMEAVTGLRLYDYSFDGEAEDDQ